MSSVCDLVSCALNFGRNYSDRNWVREINCSNSCLGTFGLNLGITMTKKKKDKQFLMLHWFTELEQIANNLSSPMQRKQHDKRLYLMPSSRTDQQSRMQRYYYYFRLHEPIGRIRGYWYPSDISS